MEVLKGRVLVKYGDNINTDLILPGTYLMISDPMELAKHAMEGLDPDFPKKVKPGDIVVAGENFGCGSSREHAPTALKAAGISAVVAESFARIFFRNSIGIGLPVFECKGISKRTKEGDDLVINVKTGIVKNLASKEELKVTPLPDFMMEIIKAGGLVPYIKMTHGKK